MLRRLRDPLLTLLVLVAVWVVTLRWFRVPDYILPAPGAVVRALKIGYIDGLYWPHFLATLEATVFGYLLGCGLAFVFGAVAADSRTFERFVYPYVVGLQSMPKVALAPLIIVWFGFGLASKVVTVALICFFPLFINTVVGIRQTDPNLIDLLRVCSATRLHTFLHVKLPAAAGHIFAGLEISVVLSLIGAVVSEFVASQRGLGNLIQAASQNLDVAAMVAVLLTLALIGVSGSLLIRYLHNRIVFWEGRAHTTAVISEA
jgi:NitT/TauT family transport system permease protein